MGRNCLTLLNMRKLVWYGFISVTSQVGSPFRLGHLSGWVTSQAGSPLRLDHLSGRVTSQVGKGTLSPPQLGGPNRLNIKLLKLVDAWTVVSQVGKVDPVPASTWGPNWLNLKDC